MDKTPSAALALLLAACTPGAIAASNTDLSVTGIITPASCTPSLSDGGVVDHGKLTARDLELDKPTSLQTGEMRLHVQCEGATFFTLTTLDNRAGSSAINPAHHGLGIINDDQKLGSVALGNENQPKAYGEDKSRDMAGVLERIGPMRWRLAIPYPRSGARLDVYELTPVAEQPKG